MSNDMRDETPASPEETMQLADSENPHAAEFAVLEALKLENAELKDQRLRALAELENVRRRAEKEKAKPRPMP